MVLEHIQHVKKAEKQRTLATLCQKKKKKKKKRKKKKKKRRTKRKRCCARHPVQEECNWLTPWPNTWKRRPGSRARVLEAVPQELDEELAAACVLSCGMPDKQRRGLDQSIFVFDDGAVLCRLYRPITTGAQ